MKIAFVTYNQTIAFNDPYDWLQRIEAYTGVLESLVAYHTIISIEQINYKGIFTHNGVQYIFFKSQKRTSFININRYLKKLSPDFVIIHGLSYPLQVLHLKKLVHNRTKIVVQHHAEKPFTKFLLFQKLADKFIDAYLFTSSELAQDWLDKIIISSKEKIWDIMEASSIFKPIDRSVAIQRTGTPGENVYLFVGRLDENKDPRTLVKAFIQFLEYNSSAHLYLIYHETDLLHELKNCVVANNRSNQIHFIGKVPHAEMLYWFNSADFIISTSHYEGSGIAVCEAMSCGCIPILTKIPSFKKMTNNSDCGLLFEKGNVPDLLNVLLQTQSMNVEEERRKVLEQFEKNLSFNAIANQLNERLQILFEK